MKWFCLNSSIHLRMKCAKSLLPKWLIANSFSYEFQMTANIFNFSPKNERIRLLPFSISLIRMTIDGNCLKNCQYLETKWRMMNANVIAPVTQVKWQKNFIYIHLKTLRRTNEIVSVDFCTHSIHIYSLRFE